MHRRALSLALSLALPSAIPSRASLFAGAAMVWALGCGGVSGAQVPAAGASAVSTPAAAPSVTATQPAVPRPTVELNDVIVRAGPVLVSYAPDPDVPAIVVPLVSREEQRLWAIHEAARRRARLGSAAAPPSSPEVTPLCGDGGVRPAPPEPRLPSTGRAQAGAGESRGGGGDSAAPPSGSLRAASSARVELVRALERAMGARPATPAAIASRMLRGYVEEVYEDPAAAVSVGAGTNTGAPTDAGATERPPAIDRAAALYREVKEAAGVDSPVGFLARLRLAALEPPADAAAEYDALLGAPLASAGMRDAVRALSGRPLGDWSRAAGVLRAATLTAASAVEKTATRTEWLVATWNAGGFREAVDLSRVLLRERGYPHVALDVAALGIARLGDARVAAGLPAASYATLMHHVASMALDDRDLVLATEAARAVLARAPDAVEAPASSAVLAACLALRGDRAGAESVLAAARESYVAAGRWGEALRRNRGADGYPSDERIDTLAGTLGAPLPASAEGEGEEGRRAAVDIRATALARRCFGGLPLAARTGALEARVAVTVETYDARAPLASARLVEPAEGTEAAPAIAAVLAPGLACVAQMGPRMFDGAPGGVRATVRVVGATTAAP